MKTTSDSSWPLPRRGPEEKSDPVELLVDVTFVLALSQAAGLMRQTPGAVGVAHALSALAVVVFLWQASVCAVTFVAVSAGPVKLLQLLQTGLFLGVAVCLPEAFANRPGGRLDGPVVFAAMMTATAACVAAQFVCVGAGIRRFHGNVVVEVAAFTALALLVWCSVGARGEAKTDFMIAAYAAGMGVASLTALPVYRWCRVGIVDGWLVTGTLAYKERFGAAYAVACCLSLELLEQAGQTVALTPVALAIVLAALGTAYVLYQLYAPLAEPARLANDPRNTAVGQGRKLALTVGYLIGHMLMCGGLVIAAGATRTVFTDLAAVPDVTGLGPPAAAAPLIELYAGISAVFVGQALFRPRGISPSATRSSSSSAWTWPWAASPTR